MRNTERAESRLKSLLRVCLVSAAVGAASAAMFFPTALAADPSSKVQMEPVKPTPVAADPEKGKRLYSRYCSQCHGAEGKGDGPAAEFVYPRPRDFTLALFKVRSTLSGQLPTDHDLFKVISKGLPGTSMPAWEKYLSEEERWQLVQYVKVFDSLNLFKEEAPKQQVMIGNAPKVTAELLDRGRQVYQDKKCWQCHGQYGRGDGTSAEGMKDDWGFPIRPVNFTKSWRFRGGDRIEDIYRTFTTGFNGTPMPSFVDSINEPDRWALAAYVKSLSHPKQTGQVVKARHLEGEIPSDPYARAWEETPYLDIPLAGQIILKPRWFKPAHDGIAVKALYNDKEMAILLMWDDGTQNSGKDGKPADQVAIELPAGNAVAGEKPYFLLGDRNHPVDYWQWNANTGFARSIASGHDRTTAQEPGGVRAEGGYKDGQYRVILRRALTPGKDGEIAFQPGRFVPVAFHLWDGNQGEEGLKMAISTWHYLLLQPPTPFTVYLWPAGLGLVAVGGEFWLMRRMRRRTARAEP